MQLSQDNSLMPAGIFRSRDADFNVAVQPVQEGKQLLYAEPIEIRVIQTCDINRIHAQKSLYFFWREFSFPNETIDFTGECRPQQ